MAANAQKLVVLERKQNGEILKHPLQQKLLISAQPGAVYTLIEETSNKPPKGMVLRRKGRALLIETDGVQVAEIQEFYSDASVAFSTDGSFSGLPDATLTPTTVTADAPEQIVWPSHSAPAGIALDGISPWAVLGGVGLAGLAAAGGGGGSSSGNNGGSGNGSGPGLLPDTTPPKSPSGVSVLSSDANDGSAASHGVNIKIGLPSDAAIGDKITTIINHDGKAVATIVTTVTAEDLARGYSVQHINYTSIDADGIIPDGVYQTVTHLTDAAGNSGPAFTNNQAFVAFTGLVHDDYIANATVFIDSNNNGQWDEGEATTTTDGNGYFKFAVSPNGAPVLATGGIDTASGAPNHSLVFKAYGGNLEADASGVDIVLSPLSTLIAAVAEQSVGAGQTVDAAAMIKAASLVNDTLGLGAADPARLLYTDPVAPATGAEATGQQIDLLAANRQLSVLLGATASLIDGASNGGSGAGSGVATSALAAVVLKHADTRSTFDMSGTSDVEAVLKDAMTIANNSGKTNDLRASNPTDLTAVAGLVAGFTSAIDSATSQGALSAGALQTMRAASDTLFSVLANAGGEAQSQRGGDLSLADAVAQVSAITDITQHVANQVANTTNITTTFETNTASGHVGGLVRLDIQLPSISLGETVDTLRIGNVPAGVTLVVINPLTKVQTVLTPDANGNYLVKPSDAGYLAVKASTALADDPSTPNVAENALSLTATKTVNGVVTTYTGTVPLNITAAPVITSAVLGSVTDDAGGRTGTIAAGATTDDSRPGLAGTLNNALTNGETVVVYDGATRLGEATVNGTSWSFTPTTALADGQHQLTIRIEDTQGKPVSASRPFNLTIDTELPVAPTINPSSGQTVSGIAEAGAVVTVSSNGVVIGTATADERGVWTLTPGSTLPNGADLTASATDAAGNVSPTSTVVEVDRAVPVQQASVSTATNDAGGVIATGIPTNDTTPTLRGALSAPLTSGQSVFVYDGDTVIGTATVTGTGWTYTPGSALPAGPHSITVRVVDTSGGEPKLGAPSPAFTFTVDADAPTQVVTIRSAYDDMPSTIGTIDNETGFVTNDARPAFSGQLSARLASGETLVAYDTRIIDGVQVDIRLGVATIYKGLYWEFTPTYALADATHSIVFRVEDLAGNVGVSSAPYTFTVDTVDSATPVITSHETAVGIEESKGPGQVIYTATADDSKDVSGGLTWSLKPNGDAADLTIDPLTGDVTLTATPDYETKSDYTFTVVVTDKAGHATEKTITVTLQDSDEIAPTITTTSVATTILENSGPNQVVYTAAADDSADISGGVSWTLKEGSDAGLSIDPETGAVTLADNPDYETKPVYTFTVVATDAAGNWNEKEVTLAIVNDDAPLSIAVSESSVIEGSAGSQTVLTYTVSRTLTTGAGTVDWAVGGDVNSAVDVAGPATGTLTFAAGEATQTFTVVVAGDKGIEGDEALTVELSNPQGDVVLGATSTASTTIANDDGTVSISAGQTQIVEGGAEAQSVLTYTVTRDNSVTASTVDWAISGIDAADLAAGQAMNGTVSFAAGETSKTLTVTVVGDKQVEANETLTVTLANPGANLNLGKASASTIVQNDDSLISVDAVRAQVTEGNNGQSQVVVFRVVRTAGSATNVDWSLEGTADAVDLGAGQAVSGTLQFAANETEKFVSITVVGDRAIEANESLTLKLSNAGDNAGIGVATATTTIVNDDLGVAIEAVATHVAEGGSAGTPVVFRVVRADTSAAASVDYRVVGTGSQPVGETDFAASQDLLSNNGLPSGTVSFAAGQSVALVTIAVSGDGVYEANETFSVVLDNPSRGLQILHGEASGSIGNDDTRYSLSAVEHAAIEGTGTNSVQHFIVTREGDLTRSGSVGYKIAGYGDNNAEADDFTSLLVGVVTFAAGQSAVTLAVDITGDSALEGYEAFRVSLEAADANTEIDKGVALATINPDDVGITISAVNSRAFEDGGGMHVFTIDRTGYLGGSAVVSWQVEGIGAKGMQADAADFGGEFPSGTVTFAPGVGSIQITFSPQADVSLEGNEAYRVVLGTTQPGVILLTPSADGLILNDESGVSVQAVNLDRMEGSEGDTPELSFSVTRSGNIKTESVVYWELVHGSTSTADFADRAALSGYLTFAVGQDNKLVSLPLSVDSNIESDKDFKIRITSETIGTEVVDGEVGGMIRNDDAQFTLNPLASVLEGNAGTRTVTMTVTRTGDLSGSDTVDYTVSGSTASAADFAGGVYPQGTLLFGAGESVQTITLTLSADSVREDDESFTVTLSNNNAGTTIAAAGTSQTVIITNDDDRLSVTASDAVKAEGGSGMTDYVFTVTRDGYTDKPTSVAWTVQGVGGAPANADDFGGTLPSGTVSFATGETVALVTVAVSADQLNESDEGFRLTLGTAPAGTEIAIASADGTIVNDDTGLAIAATTTNLVEGDNGSTAHVFTVVRTGVVTGATTVDWAVSGAVDGADFGGTVPSGTLSFAANETVKTITVLVSGDTAVETTEGFSLTLSNASGNADIQVATAGGSIVADDIQFSITATPSATVVEGAAGATQVLSYTVTRSGDTASAAIIDWAATGMSADDFSAGTQLAGSLSFAPGQKTQVINLTLKGDNVYEAGSDVLTVTLSNPANNPAHAHSYLVDATVQTTVLNDDVALVVTADSASQSEGGAGSSTPYVFTITPTGDIGADSVVEWRVSAGQTAVNDFDANQDGLGNNGGMPSGRVTFAAGQTSAIQVTVNVAGDSDVEPGEAFTVNLSTSAANVQLSGASASATIENDDTAFSIVAVDADKAEGNSGNNGTTEYTFEVVRSGVATGTAEVAWTVAGSGANPADAADFGGSFPTGTVTFTGTETTKTITVSVSADMAVELDENFTVTISGAPSPITTSTAAAVIRNEDQQFAVSAANATLTEGDSGTQPVVFTVTRTGDTSVAATVDYAVNGSAGVDSNDYTGTLPAGTLTFAANEGQKLMTVIVRGDSIAEADDSYTLVLSQPSSGTTIDVAATSAETTVLNNDVALAISAPVPLFEGSTPNGVTPVVLTVTRSGATENQQTVVDWVVQGGSATLGDFIAGQDGLGTNLGLPSGKVTFATGATQAFVTVNVAQDTQVELDDTFSVRLQHPSSTNVELVTDTATVTIKADDSGYSIAAVEGSKAEGVGGHVFSITRAGDLSQAATANWAVSGASGNSADAADFGGAFPQGSVTFNAGESVKLITLAASDDLLAESDEQFTVTLSGVPGIVGATVQGTIVNDDQNFSVTTSNIAEGNSSTKLVTFTVTRTGDMRQAATVDFSVSTANASGDDYVGSLPSGTLSFAANQTQQVVTLAVRGDTLAEADESYTLTLSGPTGGATLGTAVATATVTNDDTNYVLSAPAATYEGHSGGTPIVFTVTRNGNLSTGGSVQWKLQSAAGLAGNDFVGNQDALGSNAGLPSGTVSFAANASVTTITINVAGDVVLEGDESLRVVLSNPVGGTIEGSDGDKSTTLLTDDDSFAISGAASIVEGHADKNVIYTINRTGSLDGERALTWTISGTNGFTTAGDLAAGQASTGIITFADGASIGYLTVAVKGDTVTESNETMTVTLSGAPNNTVLQTASASTDILNDDAKVGIAVLQETYVEGSDNGFVNYTYTISRSGYINQSSTVSWSIDTTVADSVDAADFYNSQLPSGTVVFGASELTKTITLQLRKDSTFEADEKIRVALSNPSTGTEIDSSNAYSVGTVLNDDAKFEITAGTASKNEGDNGFIGAAFTYTVTRTGNLLQTNTVNWNLNHITTSSTDFSNGAGQFVGGSTYYNYAGTPNGSLTFASGESAKTITVYVRGDSSADTQTAQQYDWWWDEYYYPQSNLGSTESDETFNIMLNGPSQGSSLGTTSSFQSTIVNDDTRLSVSVDDSSQPEKTSTGGTTDFVYTVTRSGVTTGVTTVNWSIAHISTNASDFTGSTTGALTFAANQTVQTVTVRLQGDDQVENNEEFYFRLNGGSGYDEIVTPNSGVQASSADTLSYIERDEALFNIINYNSSNDGYLYRYLKSVTEGDTVDDGGSGVNQVVITVQRTLAFSGQATVTWDVLGYVPPYSGFRSGNDGYSYYYPRYNVEAAEASDFVGDVLPSGTITFASGQSLGYITLLVKTDNAGEMDEGFQVRLTGTSSGSSTGEFADGYAVIDNDDTGFTVTSGSNANEGGNLVYTIRRNDDTRGSDTIQWSWTLPGTESGNEGNTDQTSWYKLDRSDVGTITAQDGSSYTYDPATRTFSGTVTFANGEITRTITIEMLNDALTESWRERAPSMVISNPVNISAQGEINDDKETPFIETGGGSSGQPWVYDNEPDPLISVSTGGVTTVWEGTNVSGGSQVNAGNTVTFTITRSDTLADGGLNYPSVVAWRMTGTNINSGNNNVVDVSSFGGNAANIDRRYYDTTFGTVSFAANETTKTVTVTFYGDSYAEADRPLNFRVLSAQEAEDYNVAGRDYGPANVDSANASADVTLKTDDVQLSVSYPSIAPSYYGSNLAVYEGKSISFTINRSGRSDVEVTGTYAISGPGASDMTGTLTGTFTIPAGQNSVTLTLNDINVVDDTTQEATENFTLNLTATTASANAFVGFDNGTSGSKAMTGYIYDDDNSYVITNGTPSQPELDTQNVLYQFQIKRTNSGSIEPAYLKWRIEGLGGITAEDFVTADSLGSNGGLPSGQVVIYSNDIAYVYVYARSDIKVEGNDTFRLAVYEETLTQSGVVNTFATPFVSATQTIVNDDTGISIADQTITESDANQSMVFTVTRSGDLSGVSTMNWALAGLTTDAADFSGATSGSLTFGVNASVQYITVTVAGDITPEASESFTISLNTLVGIDDNIDTVAIGTINNDDSRFAISAGAAVTEGSGQVFTITRTHATVQDQVINWAVSGPANGAVAADFGGFPSGMVTFSGSELSKTVTIAASADTVNETDENYTVTISLGANTTGDTIANSTATGTIINNDADYTVSANSTTLVEGHSGSSAVVFTVTRSGAVSGGATVNWTLGGTANATDLNGNQATSGTVSFAPNQTTATITVNVLGDTTVESDETLTVTLSNAVGADGDNIIGTPATTTIANDDASISIVAVNATKLEGNSGTTAYTFNVVRTGYLGGAATVQYDVAGSGINPADSADFNGMTGTLNLAAGQATTTVTILVNADQAAELDEDFTVTLSNPSSGVTIASASAGGTIQADDVWFDVSTPGAQLEGTGGGTTDYVFVVTRSGALGASQVVNWTVAGSGADPAQVSDFAATSGAVTFAPNETAQTIHVAVNQDTLFEASEQFTLSLSGPAGAHFANNSVDATIIDDETAFSIAPGAVILSEGDGGSTSYVFTVTRSGAVSGADSVKWTFSSSDANASDFINGVLPSGEVLSFAANETTKTITIAVAGDEEMESDEHFTISLGNNSAGTQLVNGASTSTATIANDDSSVTISAASADKAEGQNGTTAFTFDVVRTGNLGTEATVAYALTGAANASDFSGLAGGLSGTLILAAHQATTTLTIFVQGDRLAELDENFTVTLSQPSTGMTIATGTASGTIRADDVVFDVSAPAAKTEGATGDSTPFEFVVTRDGKLDGSQVIAWSVAGIGGNAAGADDFAATSGFVTFEAGQTSQTITVVVKGDYASEPDEAFRLSLGAVTGDTAGVIFTRNSADATILNDEASFYLASSGAEVLEGATGTADHVFTITRTGNLALTSTVDWAVGAGASDVNDFGGVELPHGSVTFAAGVSVLTITVQTSGDTAVEADEGFVVNLSNPSTGANIITGSANGKIVSDDAAWSVSTETVPATEGDGTASYVFRVVRTGSVAATSIDWSVAGSGTDAASAADFVGGTLPSGNIVFAQGVMTQFVTVQVAGDNVREADEAFTLTLAARPDGLTHSYAQQTATATIVNDDDQIGVTAVSADNAEGSAGTVPFTFTVSRDGSLSGTSTVGWKIAHGDTNAADFAATTGTVTFADNQSVAVVTVNVVGDREVEGDQNFSVQLVNAGTGSTIDSSHASAAGVIRNDDVDLVLAADQSNAVEGDIGNAGQATFTVTRNGDLSVQTTVDWSVIAGTATAADFAGATLPSGTVTFAAGESVKTITVGLAGDGANEGNEDFAVRLSSASAHADIVSGDVAGTIIDDDDTLTVSGFNFAAAEGAAGQVSNYVFKVDRSGSAIGSATVDWQVAGSGAHPLDASEFVATSGSVSFGNGETVKYVTVQVNGDAAGEYDEGFTMSLSNPSYGSTLNAAVANAVVVNDDAVLFISADQPAGQAEGANGVETPFTFTVVRSGDASGASAVDWKVQTTDGNTVNAMDFGGAYPSGTVIFAAGETTKHLTVSLLADADGEFDERFAVVLSNPVQATILEGRAESLILNDDTGLSIAAQGPSDQAEGNAGVTAFVYRVQRVGDMASTTVEWNVMGSGDYHVNPGDFAGPTSGTVSFADGVDHADITLQVRGDDTYGPDEAFRIVLSGNPNLINAEASGVIRNDDSLVSIAAQTGVAAEGDSGDTAFVFNVSRTGATGVAAEVHWDVVGSGGHPANAADFGGTLPSGTVNFAAGESSKLVTIWVRGDGAAEADEGFTVRLSAEAGSGVSVDPTAAQASSVIAADDQGVLLFGIDTDHAEGQDGARTTYTYQVIRTGNSSSAAVVNYQITGDVDSDDFVSPLSGSLTLAAGQESYVLTLTARGDAIVERDEAFQVQLSGAFASNGPAGGVLRGDDDGVSVTARQARVSEAEGVVVFDVVASGIIDPTTVNWSVDSLGLDSVDASDFVGGILPSGSLSFSADGMQSITLQLANDSVVELDESISLQLSTSGSVSVQDGAHATVTLSDDDAASSAANVITGNDTGDILYGMGGADQIRAGGGDDVVVINHDNVAAFGAGMEVDGGEGSDTLFFDVGNETIDLSAIAEHVRGIEKLDISGTGSNTLEVSADAVAALFDNEAGPHQLMIEGDANDTVVIADFSNGWTKEANTQSAGGSTYDVYTNATSQVQLLIDVSVQQQTVTQHT